MIDTDSAAIEQCGKLLLDHQLTIAFAESATGGSLAAAFSKLPEAGNFLKGGIVCYDACLKEDLLGVAKETIETHTPESTEVTREMVIGLKKVMLADIYVAVTGLTRPGGSESEEKPVGTIFFCIAQKDQISCCVEHFTGSEDSIIGQTIEQISRTITKTLANQA
ncbi:CinA family protein [Olivibacter ginsenosidimutans]|uniref:CinA family protein n=1 Tax=Olivibacter ginsenosidimutans TaxID=1176537 RepID=A0ABP9AEL7_9SPHI